MSNEFYKIVVRERERLQERSSCKVLRWFTLKEALDKCHPYFAKRSVKQVSQSFFYLPLSNIHIIFMTLVLFILSKAELF